MLGGLSYPWLCPSCRRKVNIARREITLAIKAGIDSPDFGTPYTYTDEEAPCNLVYDRRDFCGKTECIN